MGSTTCDPVSCQEKVTIQADRILDGRAQDVFIRACRQADHPDIYAIEVDLTATRGIRASGVSMLLMLSSFGKRFSFQVKLVNCNPQMKEVLAASRLLSNLSIA